MKQLLLKNKKGGFTQPSKTVGFTQPTATAGFTMVETLVAISILLVVIIGPMTIAQKGIQNAYFARDQLTAVFLAQEAIEAVREKRDEQALHVYNQLIDETSPSDSTWVWLNGVTAICTELEIDRDPQKECRFNPSSGDHGEFESCNSGGGVNCARLRVYDDGRYTYGDETNNSLSLFTRKVYIEKVGSNAVKVRVVVTWDATAFANTKRTVELQTWMYDRYKHYES